MHVKAESRHQKYVILLFFVYGTQKILVTLAAQACDLNYLGEEHKLKVSLSYRGISWPFCINFVKLCLKTN